MNDDIYFYGIDFKKIRLFCKITVIGAITIKNLFRKEANKHLIINTDKFYEVIEVDFHDQFVKINVSERKTKYDEKKREYYITDEDYIKIRVHFKYLEFSYFFENTKEDELKKASI